jgi:hypothetical protein
MRANEIRSKHAYGEGEEDNKGERRDSAPRQLSQACARKFHNLFAG